MSALNLVGFLVSLSIRVGLLSLCLLSLGLPELAELVVLIEQLLESRFLFRTKLDLDFLELEDFDDSDLDRDLPLELTDLTDGDLRLEPVLRLFASSS